MRTSLLLAVAGSSLAAVSPILSAHARAPGWRSSPARTDSATELIELTYCIRIDGVEELEAALWAVSDPASPKYGQHWSIDRIAEVSGTRPRAAAVAAWARAFSSHVDVTVGGDYVRAWLAPAQAERMLGLTLHRYHHEIGGHRWAPLGEARVPQRLADSIAFVSGLDLPAVRQSRSRGAAEARLQAARRRLGEAKPRTTKPKLAVPVVEARDRAFVAHLLLTPKTRRTSTRRSATSRRARCGRASTRTCAPSSSPRSTTPSCASACRPPRPTWARRSAARCSSARPSASSTT